jgi:hypothetical protein
VIESVAVEHDLATFNFKIERHRMPMIGYFGRPAKVLLILFGGNIGV